jgi:hypothetical protein
VTMKRGSLTTKVIGRTLSRRLERLELLSRIASTPLVINVQFVSSDGLLVDRLTIVCSGPEQPHPPTRPSTV